MQVIEGFFIWVDKTMFSKVQKIVVAVIVLMGSLVSTGPLLAATEWTQASLVSATPYDSRIAQAGLPSIPTGIRTVRSSEDLFDTARSFRYRKDERGRDYWQTPQETEASWAGDCEDKSLWLFAQMKINGFDKTRLVIGRQNASSKGLHVWVTLMEDNGSPLYILDPTNQKRIWKITDFSEGEYRPVYSFDGSNRYRHDA